MDKFLPCCPQKTATQLSVQLHYLGRLLLANGSDEVLPDQQSWLETRLVGLRTHLQRLVQLRCHVSALCARDLVEHLVAVLLKGECCRRSLRRHVALADALGPTAGIT